MRLFQGLSAATGGQVKEFEFARENLVTGYATNHSVSGVYTFTDEHHLSITADPPKAFSVNAELNGAYDTMIIHDVGGLQARYRKAVPAALENDCCRNGSCTEAKHYHQHE